MIDCPRGEIVPELEVYVAHNIVFYEQEDLDIAAWSGGKLVKYWHDIGPHLQPWAWDMLRAEATHICCSPIQREYLDLTAELIPPAIDLQRFRDARSQNGVVRKGIVALGPWMNHGKHPRPVFQWADGLQVDFYGSGPLAPLTARPVDYEDLPALLARYETFVHLPLVIEPFGRGVAEAWAAGCKVITNRLVGARYWIEERPLNLDSAAADFWKLVLA